VSVPGEPAEGGRQVAEAVARRVQRVQRLQPPERRRQRQQVAATRVQLLETGERAEVVRQLCEMHPPPPPTTPKVDTSCTPLSLIPKGTGKTIRAFYYARTTDRSPRKLDHGLAL
jgi:hypothetical protein